nr:PREDICTED: uncharacterized protein LOC108953629 isoform X1 [Musa acuminata subsp. malaccensis]
MEDREAEVPPLKFGMVAEEICRSGFPTATDFGSLEELIIRTRFLCPKPHPENIIRFPGFVCSCSESKVAMHNLINDGMLLVDVFFPSSCWFIISIMGIETTEKLHTLLIGTTGTILATGYIALQY